VRGCRLAEPEVWRRAQWKSAGARGGFELWVHGLEWAPGAARLSAVPHMASAQHLAPCRLAITDICTELRSTALGMPLRRRNGPWANGALRAKRECTRCQIRAALQEHCSPIHPAQGAKVEVAVGHCSAGYTLVPNAPNAVDTVPALRLGVTTLPAEPRKSGNAAK
jgi:hypothetical protein